MLARGEIFTHPGAKLVFPAQLIADMPQIDNLKIYVDLITIK
ncbi:hypothetical protein FORC065_2342 [Yersinia enterocolitica]|nr:hypothetical protein FORC065_2342 [Yersinia enterocolitica]